MSEFSSARLIERPNGQIDVSYGDDRSTFATFYSEAVLNEEQTELQGRPIYDNVDMVRIMFPADSTKEVVARAEHGAPPYIQRYPRQWEAYKQQKEQVASGTPVEHWAPINRATALELKGMGIHTVEMLAAVTDTNLKWMGARKLRDNAIAWLAEADAGAEVIKMQAEIDALRTELAAAVSTIKALGQTTDKTALTTQPIIAAPLATAPVLEYKEEEIKPIQTRMRGRPRKVEDGSDTVTTDTSGE